MFLWRNKELKMYGDIIDAVTRLTTKEEAKSFYEGYRLSNPHAAENIGYLLGYLGEEQYRRLYDLFPEEVAHPVFGKKFGR